MKPRSIVKLQEAAELFSPSALEREIKFLEANLKSNPTNMELATKLAVYKEVYSGVPRNESFAVETGTEKEIKSAGISSPIDSSSLRAQLSKFDSRDRQFYIKELSKRENLTEGQANSLQILMELESEDMNSVKAQSTPATEPDSITPYNIRNILEEKMNKSRSPFVIENKPEAGSNVEVNAESQEAQLTLEGFGEPSEREITYAREFLMKNGIEKFERLLETGLPRLFNEALGRLTRIEDTGEYNMQINYLQTLRDQYAAFEHIKEEGYQVNLEVGDTEIDSVVDDAGQAVSFMTETDTFFGKPTYRRPLSFTERFRELPITSLLSEDDLDRMHDAATNKLDTSNFQRIKPAQEEKLDALYANLLSEIQKPWSKLAVKRLNEERRLNDIFTEYQNLVTMLENQEEDTSKPTKADREYGEHYLKTYGRESLDKIYSLLLDEAKILKGEYHTDNSEEALQAIRERHKQIEIQTAVFAEMGAKYDESVVDAHYEARIEHFMEQHANDWKEVLNNLRQGELHNPAPLKSKDQDYHLRKAALQRYERYALEDGKQEVETELRLGRLKDEYSQEAQYYGYERLEGLLKSTRGVIRTLESQLGRELGDESIKGEIEDHTLRLQALQEILDKKPAAETEQHLELQAEAA